MDNPFGKLLKAVGITQIKRGLQYETSQYGNEIKNS